MIARVARRLATIVLVLWPTVSPLWAQASPVALFVVGNSSSLGSGDLAVESRLQSQLGYTVVVETASSVQASDATGKTIIVISSTAGATSSVATALAGAAVPIVTWDSNLFPGLNMTGATAGTSYGTTADHFTQVVISTANPTNPVYPPAPQDPAAIAAGYPNSPDPNAVVSVATVGGLFSWGWPWQTNATSGNGFIVATAEVGTNQAAIFGFEQGSLLFDNKTKAPGRRLGLFMTDNTAASFTTSGWQLFDRAILWTSFTDQAPHLSFLTAPPVDASQSLSLGVGGYVQATDDGIPYSTGQPTVPAPLTFTWSTVSGPQAVTFSANPSLQLNSERATFQAPPNINEIDHYVLGLSASDGITAGTGTLPVTVQYVSNNPPVVTASAGTTTPVVAQLTPPSTSVQVTLTGTCSDDGLPNGTLQLTWTQVSGPSGVTLPAPSSCPAGQGGRFNGSYSSNLTFTSKGLYDLRLQACDAGPTVCNSPNPPAGDISTVFVTVEVQAPALLVTSSATLTAGSGDLALYNELTSLGFNVTVKASSAVAATDANNKLVVVISNTASATSVGTKFQTVAVPVVVLNSGLLGSTTMKMATAAGTVTAQSQVAMTNSTSPLSAGLSGNVTVVTSPTSFTWGTPSSSAVSVASVVGAPSESLIFGYAPGASMAGLTAPARRVGFFAQAVAMTELTSAGRILLDAAIGWAASTNTAPKINPGPNQVLSMPVSSQTISTVLNGSYIDDGLPNPPGAVTPTWTLTTEVNVPPNFQPPQISNANVWTPTVTFFNPGLYTFTLSATDGELLGTCQQIGNQSCQMTVEVSQPNTAPAVTLTASATTLALGQGATLTAGVTDDGLPTGTITMTWSQVEGPSAASLGGTPLSLTNTGCPAARPVVSPNLTVNGTSWSGTESVTFPAPGSYTLQLCADDGVSPPALGTATQVPFSVSSTALLVVGNASALTSDDLFIMNRLTSKLNYAVTVTDGKSVTSGATSSSGKAVVVIAPTAVPADVSTKFRAVTVPVVTLQSGIFNNMGITTSTNAGAVSNQRQVTVVAANTDPMSAGLTGPVTVGFPSHFNWGTPGSGGVTVATLAGSTTQATIFRYSKGAALPIGGTAAASRVGFFATSDSFINPVQGNTTMPSLNTVGLALFDEAVTWATSTPAPAVVTAGPDQALAGSCQQSSGAFSSVSTTLAGTAFPPTVPVLWSVLSPSGASATLTSPSSPQPTATFAGDGQYIVTIAAQDGSNATASANIFVQCGNQPPVVHMVTPDLIHPGQPSTPDPSVNLPAQVQIAGTITDDGLPNPPHQTTALWTQVAGPGIVTFGNPSSPVTTASFDQRGRYILRLSATDGTANPSDPTGLLWVPDDRDLNVDVNATALLVTQAAGSLTSAESALQSRMQMLGFTVGTIDAASSASSSADNMSVVVISPTASSTNVGTKFKTVLAPVITTNTASYVSMGLSSSVGTTTTNQLTFPTPPPAVHPLAAGLTGLATVSNANTSVGWGTFTTKPSGVAALGTPPGSSTEYAIIGYEKGTTMVSGQATARRVAFGLVINPSVINDTGWSLFDEAVRWAAGVNNPPRVVIGSVGPLTLPAGSSPSVTTQLPGQVYDDGVPGPLTIAWSVAAGPSGVSFDNPGNPTANVTFTQAGIYVLRLMASDTELVTWAQVTVVVNPSSPAAGGVPLVNAGPSVRTTVGLPVTLYGTVDAAGVTPGYTIGWSQVTGPGSVTFQTSSQSPQTSVVFPSVSSTGTVTYVMRLSVSYSVNGVQQVVSSDTVATVDLARNVLLVATVPATASDDALANHLQQEGYQITLIGDSAATSANAAGKQLVIISSDATATTSTFQSALATLAVPVIAAQANVYHGLGMADPTSGTDFGTTTGQTELTMTEGGLSLKAGFTTNATPTVTFSPDTFSWINALNPPWGVATISGTSEPSIFAFETGMTMLAAVVAPARRVGFFSTNVNNFTDEGWALLDAAVAWATGARVPVLYIQGTSPSPSPTASEARVQAELVNLGYSLTIKKESTVVASDLNPKSVALIVISRTIDPTQLSPSLSLQSVPVPIISFEPASFSLLGMTGSVSGTDYGTVVNQTEVDITTPSDPLAAGLSGRQQILVSPDGDFGWANPAPSASRVAVITGYSYGATIFDYEQGATMAGGVVAAARRVGMFMNENTLSQNGDTNVTPAGWALFDAAVNWCGAADPDHDGLSTFDEFRFGTDPTNPDTNDDGILDGPEIHAGMSATNMDMDGDGLTNTVERHQMGTDPFNPDTDGDGTLDGVDCLPLDPTYPSPNACPTQNKSDTNPPTITLTVPSNATLVSTTTP